MKHRTKSSFAAALLGAPLVVALTIAGPGAASAAAGDVVCELARGDSLVLRVVDNGDSSFHVTVIDAVLLAAESSDSDAYAELPTEPVDLRFSAAEVQLGALTELVPGSLTLSQGIATAAPSGAVVPFDFTLTGAGAPAGETVSESGGTVAWAADLDIATTPDGVRSIPSDFFFPGLAIDASSSVLEFDVRPSAAAPYETDLELLLGMTVELNGALFSPAENSYSYSPDSSTTRTLGGCTVPAAFLPAPPLVDPEIPVPPVAQPSSPQLAESGFELNAALAFAATLGLVGASAVASAAARTRRSL